MKRFFLTIFILGLLLAPLAVLAAKQGGLGAAGGVLSTVGSKTGLGGDLNLTFGALAKGLLGTVGTIFFFLTIYAGILWLTAAGNEERITKAKTILFTCVIGLFITMSAYAITSFITTRLGGSPQAPASSGSGPTENVWGCCVHFTIDPVKKTTQVNCNDVSGTINCYGDRDQWYGQKQCSSDARCSQYVPPIVDPY